MGKIEGGVNVVKGGVNVVKRGVNLVIALFNSTILSVKD